MPTKLKENTQTSSTPPVRKKIPTSPNTHWFYRGVLDFRKDPTGYSLKMMHELGNIFQILLPLNLFRLYSVQSPDYAKHFLVTNNRNYIKDLSYKRMKISLGNGLLTSEGEFWRRQRRIAQPAFHREQLAGMADTMIESVSERLQSWEQIQTPFDLSREMSVLTSDIAAKALFGSDLKNKREIAQSLVTGMRYITHNLRYPINPPLWLPLPSTRKFVHAQQVLDRSIMGMIEQRRKGGKTRDDLLAMLMDAQDEETGEQMTDQQLRDECITIFSAGHETSANGLTWTLYLLDKNPHIREQLEAEIDQVLAGRMPTLDDLPHLPYNLQVIQESMRLFPPAWGVGREALEADEVDGYPIPKRAQVMIHIYSIHRHPDYWEAPERFDPDRFTKAKVKSRHRYAYLPFGGGPRFCIGNNFALMEMQLALAMIVQRYRLRLVPGHPVKQEPLITLRPLHGVMMALERRED